MIDNKIIQNIFKVSQHPFLIFVDRVEEKPDNSIETLRLLLDEGDVTAGRISEYLDIKPSSVTQIIKKLEAIEMVERIKSTEDARVTLVRLTVKGKKSVKERVDVSSVLEESLFQGFTEDELKQFDEYLEKLATNVSSDEFTGKLKRAFGDDLRWQKFDKMSSHFSRAREQMMDRGNEGPRPDFNNFGHSFRGRGLRR